ncbi:AAA family ATPase [Leptonema illini]|uniref:ATPase associated with various cellular activities AAA_3 n=1 Tax=Leptonema illini DSM 21528 TaxID=929563 RepID=H2CE51_9LEPT|nr:MoxR family ATPase [Leptonema illini]EHQ06603.1 ATPase associated with various cellular activities AAA_3 [Leptonema illini DSM 21528]
MESMNQMLQGQEIESALQRLQDLRSETAKLFIGQQELVTGVICGILSGGHVLIEGVPGLGKTLLAKSLATALGCQFNRIQFTPDLMPADITGTHIYHTEKQKFLFYKGPVFTNMLLADEINRAPAKTHSALLEIMQERSVTLDGKQYGVDEPFFVIATQNPIESEGTYGLPEAQLDRFMLKLNVEYPQKEEEIGVYRMHLSGGEPDPQKLRPVLDAAGILSLRQVADRVFVSDSILHYVHRLIDGTRKRRDLAVACSPRAALAVLRASRVRALMKGRGYVLPDDIKEMAPAAFRHRLRLQPEAYLEGIRPDDIIADLLSVTEVPEKDFGA